jgi:hypothetical protein
MRWSRTPLCLIASAAMVASLAACPAFETGQISPAALLEENIPMPLPPGVEPLRCAQQQQSRQSGTYTPDRGLTLEAEGYRFTIPARSIDSTAVFVMFVRPATQPEVVVYPVGQFDGFHNDAPARLRMSYAHCETDQAPTLRIRRYRLGGPQFGDTITAWPVERQRALDVPLRTLTGYLIAQG